MPELNATLRVVVQFLQAHGFDQQEQLPSTENGRWLFDTCQTIIAGGVCPCCVNEVLKQMFRRLEDGSVIDGTPLAVSESPWSRADTNCALRAGGFPEWEQ